jgi:hypothetical protein
MLGSGVRFRLQAANRTASRSRPSLNRRVELACARKYIEVDVEKVREKSILFIDDEDYTGKEKPRPCYKDGAVIIRMD